MKIILTGSTGFIGSHTLNLALTSPTITEIIALTRRPLRIKHPKLKSIILEDFTVYPYDVLAKLQGAEACIWALGVKAVDPATHRLVTLEYTRAAIKAFASLDTQSGRPFRFVFTSGMLAERDPMRKLWFLAEARYIKGEAETAVLGSEGVVNGGLEVYVLRPGQVMFLGMMAKIGGTVLPVVGVDTLAACMVELAARGKEVGKERGSNDRILENEEIVRRGKKALEKRGRDGEDNFDF